ncbi:MAG: alcohol dehydrogenase catalytic domain-containing protein [Deltaproteobacteria bacterium]|nr:alcohol dehydrogenase catalytic domain-containing protein [Deltaproteobacteria bacterium]
MRALVLSTDGPRVEERPVRALPGEALLRPTVGGVCATDLELIKGYMGFEGVLGHEWVGVVEESGDASLVGQRVVGDINCPCRSCATCLAGHPTHCPHRTVLGIQGRQGAFAEALSLPASNLHRVPDAVSDEAAVFVEPLAAAIEILQQIHIRPTDEVVVLGVGRLGQLCARVLALTGARVRGVSRNPARLELLPSHVGRATLAQTDDDLAAGRRADIVVDCTGNPDGLALATKLVRPRGTLVLKTTTHDLGDASPVPWVIDEITLVGSRCGPFAPALRMLEAGLVDPTPLISAEYALADGMQALKRAAQRDTVKVLLRIS